uniref:Uncharacterized protein n=1 Tax=Arundo donax TaxID=35708 RepID=A0A0A9BB67_ARUDO
MGSKTRRGRYASPKISWKKRGIQGLGFKFYLWEFLNDGRCTKRV